MKNVLFTESQNTLKPAVAITLDACRKTINNFILQMNKTEETFLDNGSDEKLAIITTLIDTTSSELREGSEQGTINDMFKGIAVLLQHTMDIEKMRRANIEKTGVDACEELEREFGDKPEALETIEDTTMLDFYNTMRSMRNLHEILGALMVIAFDPETGLSEQQKKIFSFTFNGSSELKEFAEEKYIEFKTFFDEADRDEDGYISKLANYRFVSEEISTACDEFTEMIAVAFNTIPNDNPKKNFVFEVTEYLNGSMSYIPNSYSDPDLVTSTLRIFMVIACEDLLRIMNKIHVITDGALNEEDNNPKKAGFIEKCENLEVDLQKIKNQYLDKQIAVPSLGSSDLKADINVLRRSASTCLNLELAMSNHFKQSEINPYEEKTEDLNDSDYMGTIFFNVGKEICYEAYRFSLLVIACLESDADIDLMAAALLLWSKMYGVIFSFGTEDTDRVKKQEDGYEFTDNIKAQYDYILNLHRQYIGALQCGYSVLLSLLPDELMRTVMEFQKRLYQPRSQLSSENYGACIIPAVHGSI